jgi:ATP-dependent Clp protease ATP-binding subunit ClpC
VKITLPIYIQKQATKGSEPPMHILRPLFHQHLESRGEDLNRALTKLAQKLRKECGEYGDLWRHDRLARFAFSPELEDHFHKFDFEMASRRARSNLLIVVIKSLGRRIAFTPSVPDLWFEIQRGETLASRAIEVLTQYFREKERKHGKDALTPEALSIEGKAWVTTLDLSIQPPKLAVKARPSLFAMLGGGEKLNGAQELEATGRCLDYLYPDDLQRVIFREPEVEELTAILQAADSRPLLLTGRRLAGKTAIIHEYVYRAVHQKRSKFSADNQLWLMSPQRLISGMSYVGQWENRLLAILKEARKRNHILYFDDLLGLYQAGQSSNSSLSIADVLKPYVEKRAVRILGEITPEAFRVLQERDRGFADSFHLLHVREPDEDSSFRILLHLMRQLERMHRCAFATEVFPTVMDLQRRYVRDAAFPGKAAVFLQQLAVKFRNERVSREDVLQQFHAKSGLALTFLNDGTKLQRREIVEAIGKEVIGQEAALAACADVITLAKARLNHPERPLAAFLFLGPTGVGKTQCAKSLAAYLFGDSDRILRFDMNEYASGFAAARLVGTFRQPEGLLTSAVRRQPFSVVLLDEIEKAHPDVFNLLLQVMGDGRLTDALGRTVDFTNVILILTSNLGVREAARNLGFRSAEAKESHIYVQAAESFFKPEFFNRLDRVVPFESLTRAHIKEIAQGLMRNIFAREGLVRRRCILQVDERAMENIIDAGYDPQLGARALKRMLERQLSQPVAARLATLKPDAPTIIGVHQTTAGIAVTVDALQGAEANETSALVTGLLEPSRILELAEATLSRIEESTAQLRPEGMITPGEVAAHHLAYFQIREQAQSVRELGRRVESRRLAAKTRLTSRARGRSISAAQFTLRQTTAGNLWQRLINAADIRNLCKELAAGAQPHGERLEDDLAELMRETSLLEALARTAGDEPDNRFVLLIHAMDEASGPQRKALAKAYGQLFEHSFGLQVNHLQASGELASLHAEALVMNGAKALKLARCEAGTHLFYTGQGGLMPVQVDLLRLSDENEMAAIRRIAERLRQRLKPQGVDESNDLPRLPDIIRVYESEGVTLDLRSGLMTLRMPAPDELRALVLATLPLPAELAEAIGM